MIVPFEGHASGALEVIDGAARERRQASESFRQSDVANDGTSLAQRRTGVFDRTPSFRLRFVPQLGAAEPDARHGAQAAQPLWLVYAQHGREQRDILDRAADPPGRVDAFGRGIDACLVKRVVGRFIAEYAQNEDGRSTEPPVWVPSAAGTMKSAGAAADPLDEPPGVCAALCGFVVAAGAMPASSQVAVLPRITAPAWRNSATQAASASGR